MGYTRTQTKRVVQVSVGELANFAGVPKQQVAWEALQNFRYILYGGARGGGKSRFLRWALLLLLLWWAKQGIHHVVVGLFCHTYRELQDRQIGKIAEEFPAWLGEIKDSQEHGLGFYLKEKYGGGIIALRNLDDPEKYKSAEFAAIAVDELTLVLKWVFDILRGSLRWPGISHTIFIAATNPDGVGNLWVRELWIEHLFPEEMEKIADQFIFVPALPKENPYLDHTYWDDLRSQPPDVQKAWVEGDWYIYAGQAFKAFRKERHVIEPVELNPAWTRWMGIDWGKSSPCVCLWGARDPDNGRLYIYRELTMLDMEDRQQARHILDSSPPNEKIAIRFADPSLWPRKQKEFPSTAEVYAQNGLALTAGDNDRISGKRRIDRMLANLPDGKPGLLIFETCTQLWRTLPALVYDKVQIEDVDTDGPDHHYDALRYLTSAVREYQPPPPQRRRNRSPLAEILR